MDTPNIPGLGFYPTDDELLTYYLKQRILDYFQDQNQSTMHSDIVPDIDLYSMHPKDLPCQFKRLVDVKSNGREWVFFCVRKEKYRNSSRSERTVPNVGYWKITSKPKDIRSESMGNAVGSKSILTFYEQRHPKGIKTDWILHEYHLNASCLGYNINEMPFVVCRLYNKGCNLDESTNRDQSTGHSNSEASTTSYPPTSVEIAYEQEMWQSLPQIQQLPHSSSDYNASSFVQRAEYHYNDQVGSSFGGFYDGSGSSSYYPSNDEPRYYQQDQGGWNPLYHY